MALVDLGKQTSLSVSLLSQIERGKQVPTLHTLSRIAEAFEVGIDYFFADAQMRRTFSIVRANDRLPASTAWQGFAGELLAMGGPEQSVCTYLAQFPAGEAGHTHQHEGAEFLYMLRGSLTLVYQDDSYLLRAGDSVYFDAREAHTYSGQTEEPAHAIIMTITHKLLL
jgi:quercetin dioxygenase-like cupin family protein/DNA-binding XRE family transcriptional regulator